jgi:hypothetical protein
MEPFAKFVTLSLPSTYAFTAIKFLEPCELSMNHFMKLFILSTNVK